MQKRAVPVKLATAPMCGLPTEQDARDFINDANDVSVEVKTQMLAAIGLN